MTPATEKKKTKSTKKKQDQFQGIWINVDDMYKQPYKVNMTPKQIEEALGIEKQDQTSSTAEKVQVLN